MKQFFAVLAVAAGLACQPVRADPSPEDRQAVREVISAQIAAFGRDDGQAAYGFAAAGIQKMFPSPDAFMAMVRQAYAAVVRPRTMVFGRIEDGAAGVEQEVLITDGDGVDWVARYIMTRDADGRWRIQGCRLVRNERDSA